MKNLFLILLFVLGCSEKKKTYYDYNENEFYEVQGVITKTVPTSDPFDSPRKRNIFYDYHLDFSPPLKGSENGIDLVLRVGDPIVVLVHKDDINITFYGRFGIIDESLEIKQP